MYGAVSWGGVCAAPDQPGLYTRVNRKRIIFEPLTCSTDDNIPYVSHTKVVYIINFIKDITIGFTL